MPLLLNDAQRVAVRAYDGGEHCRCESPEDAEDVGDTLFSFIIRELSEREDCDSFDEAVRRLEVARQQLDEVIEALSSADVSA
jgi:hypothetical protein